jgi:ATP-binding cassette, subfamily C, bacterial
MIRLFQMFFGSKGANPWMVLLCLTSASIAQGFGIASMVPLISVLGDKESGQSSLAAKTVVEILGYVGLPPDLGVLLLVVVFAIVLKSVLTILAMIYVARAVADVANGLRAKLIEALLKARWSYFTSKPTGALVNSVGMESSLSGSVYLMISRFLSSVIQTVIYIGVAFAVSWKLALISLLVGGVIVLTLHFFVRMAEKAGKRGIKRSRELVTRLSDAIIGLKPLKAMGREDEFGRLFSRKIDQIRKATRREIMGKNLLSNLQEPMLMVMMAGGLFVLVTHFQMPIATVVVMGVLLQRTVNSLGKLQVQFQEAIATESAYRSVRRTTDEADRAREPVSGTRRASLESGCEFRNVWFSFGSAPVLCGLNLEIPVKRLTLVIGASGTGKTTLTDLLLGFYRPDRGEILIDGVPLTDIDVRSWRRSIGYVPQELILLHDTILANITLGDPSIGEERVAEALRVAGAADFMARLPAGLHTEVGEKGARFSGGQRQRIAIARALVHRPKLLILDEVTSALDTETEQDICRNIRNILSSVTVLAVSHSPAWIDVADNVLYVGQDTDEHQERTTLQTNRRFV